MGYLEPPPLPAPVVVRKDVGGLVHLYRERTEQYRRENREVRLHECRSACTLALSLPNVCVYPGSVLKFHAAYDDRTKIIDANVSADLFGSYPPAVRERLGGLTRQYRNLTGSELIRLGVRDCTETPEIMLARARRTTPSSEPQAPVIVASAEPGPPPRAVKTVPVPLSAPVPLPPARPGQDLSEPPAAALATVPLPLPRPAGLGPVLVAAARPASTLPAALAGPHRTMAGASEIVPPWFVSWRQPGSVGPVASLAGTAR